MKCINETRATKSFMIDGHEAKDLGRIANHFGNDLIAIARDGKAELGHYTVRIANKTGIRDHRIYVDVPGLDKNIKILETVVIAKWMESDEEDGAYM